MPTELIIANIGLTFSVILSSSLALLVYLKRPKEGAMPNIMFTWLFLAGLTWMISYGAGINIHDPVASSAAFMFSILSALFIVIMNSHLILVMAGRFESQKRFISVLYAIAGFFVVFYVFFPHTLLLPSQPQLYMANFFVAGSLFWVQDSFFFFCFIYFLVQAFLSYFKADHMLKNRLKYFIFGNVIVWGLGILPEFLLYGISIDPLPATLIGLYNIPFAYAILKYNVIDINILARRALGYAASVAGVTIFILLIGYANDTVVFLIPSFPRWLLPLISGMLAVALGVIVWKKVKEVDVLKYQFVNVVTHKFRTPLTHIRWSVENIRAATDEKDKNRALEDISQAHERLFQLTDMLAGLSASDNSEYLYTFEPHTLNKLVAESVSAVEARARERKVSIENRLSEALPEVLIDRQKIQFAIQTVIENSLTYSYSEGRIEIGAEVKKGMVVLTIRDYGIGISDEDMPRLFSKFYRGNNALRAHTEGMGIGLYLSRDILQRHGGDLTATSEGPGKGSTFLFKIPVAQGGPLARQEK
jgi:signal transduction histidine kinase